MFILIVVSNCITVWKWLVAISASGTHTPKIYTLEIVLTSGNINRCVVHYERKQQSYNTSFIRFKIQTGYIAVGIRFIHYYYTVIHRCRLPRFPQTL